MSVIAEREQKARKRHRCDSCGRAINPGDRYLVHINNDYGFSVFKSHIACNAASNIIYYAAGLYPYDGLPLVSNMELEDRETIAEEDQDVFIAIWGAG